MNLKKSVRITIVSMQEFCHGHIPWMNLFHVFALLHILWIERPLPFILTIYDAKQGGRKHS